MSPLSFTALPGALPLVFSVASLSVILLVLWNASGVARARSRTTLNAEDPALFGAHIQVIDDDPPQVARLLRAYHNATAISAPFMILAFLLVLLGASATAAWITFGTFVVARVIHALAYARGTQPWRTVSYTVSLLAVGAVIVQMVVALVT